MKAFNTTFAGPLTRGEVAARPLDVLIAGGADPVIPPIPDYASSAGFGRIARRPA